ncbi:two-component system response regulator [Mucilaginibacter sp. BT774]|uniref:response regulator n=1 Tax=Mucilaginibacter sp. BT774 TaxID=3062276 RepID=UPI002674892C|nr:response regulator [Mucilaginibacter sp. BT774]MDO3624607.1 response regulator [Mucilaginibacter sp. BT774]
MRKLVFIDDDPIDHFLMKHILRGKNYFDITTYTIYGSLVLDYIEEYKSQPEKLPDMIFVDLNMPLFSGWDFLKRMEKMYNEISKEIPVFVISSSLRPDDRATSSKYSFVQDFISKPVNGEEIERIIHTQNVTGS